MLWVGVVVSSGTAPSWVLGSAGAVGGHGKLEIQGLWAWHWRLVTSHGVTRQLSPPLLTPWLLDDKEEVDDKVAWHLRTPGILANFLRLGSSGCKY